MAHVFILETPMLFIRLVNGGISSLLFGKIWHTEKYDDEHNGRPIYMYGIFFQVHFNCSNCIIMLSSDVACGANVGYKAYCRYDTRAGLSEDWWDRSTVGSKWDHSFYSWMNLSRESIQPDNASKKAFANEGQYFSVYQSQIAIWTPSDIFSSNRNIELKTWADR